MFLDFWCDSNPLLPQPRPLIKCTHPPGPRKLGCDVINQGLLAETPVRTTDNTAQWPKWQSSPERTLFAVLYALRRLIVSLM